MKLFLRTLIVFLLSTLLLSQFACLAEVVDEAIEEDTLVYSIDYFYTIDPNATSNGVTALQLRLQELGYYEGKITGTYDEASQDALIAFQTANGFEADGVANPETLAALFNAGALDAEGNPAEAYRMLTAQYIGNKNTKKFHYANCQSVSDMSEKNKVAIYSRDEAIDAGYKPCKRCNP